jgi:DNA-binding MarR family transcriptional regulator
MEQERRLALLLRQADRRVTARLSALLVERGSSLEQWHVLSCLADGSGRAMSEIGAAVVLPAPTMSKLIDGMVASNLVYRRADVRDRRRVLVFLTARGHRLTRRLSPAVERQQEELLGALGEKDTAVLLAHLTAFVQQLDSLPTSPEEPSARGVTPGWRSSLPPSPGTAAQEPAR